MRARGILKLVIALLTMLFALGFAGSMPPPGEVLTGSAAGTAKPGQAGPATKPGREKKIGFSTWSDHDFHHCFLVLVETPAGQDGADPGIGIQIMADAPVYAHDQPQATTVTDESGSEHGAYYAFSFEMPHGFLDSGPGVHRYSVPNDDPSSGEGDFAIEVRYDGSALAVERRLGNGSAEDDHAELLLGEGAEPLELSLSLSRRTVVGARIRHCTFAGRNPADGSSGAQATSAAGPAGD